MEFWSVSLSACVYMGDCGLGALIYFLVSAICLFVGDSQASVEKASCCDTTASIHKWAITLLFLECWQSAASQYCGMCPCSPTHLILRNKSDSITTDWLKPLYQYGTSWTNVTSLCMLVLVWHTPRAVGRGWINRSVLPFPNKACQLKRKWQVQQCSWLTQQRMNNLMS